MRRTWFIAAIVIGVLAIVVAAIAMRLSDDGGQPTSEEWAGSICTSLGDWRTSINALADVGGQQLTPDLLRQKLADAEDATSQLVTELGDLGAPDLEEGDRLRDELDSSTQKLESSFDRLKESASEAANAPAGEFLRKLAALATDFAALQTAISETVTTIESADVGEETKAELRQAFTDAPACRSLRAQG